MLSRNVYTDEIDDLKLAAAQLHEQLIDFPFYSTSLGIIFCDVETDEQELIRELRKYYDFPIIGSTAVAMLTSSDGYQDTGISLLVLSCKDCEFLADITGELTAENAQEEIQKTYARLSARLTKPERLALVYAPQTDYLYGDNIVKYFNEANPSSPLFGGIASDNFTLNDSRVFCNDISANNRIVIVLIAGALKPVFQQQFIIVDEDAEAMDTVTKSEGNVVYEMSNGKFMDIMESKGLITDEADAYLKFVGSVFEAKIPVDNGELVSVMRDIRSLDFNTKSAYFLGNVPVGSKMRLCMLNKENIRHSVQQAFDDVLAEIKAHPEIEYSTILCSSCAGRFLNLANEPTAEGDVCQELLPPGLALSGFYTYGEICPTSTPSGKLYNIFHNKTFTIVAI